MNPRVRVFDTATKPVVVVDRWPDVGDYPASEMDGAVVLFFSGDVDTDPEQLVSQTPPRQATARDMSGWQPLPTDQAQQAEFPQRGTQYEGPTVDSGWTLANPTYEVVADETYRGETKPVGGGAELP